jgi:hypothetical protein
MTLASTPRNRIGLAGHCYALEDGAIRDISDCHFRKTATEHDREPGMNWLSCTAK